MEQLQFPIGRFESGKTYDFAQTKLNVQTLKNFPAKLKALIDATDHSKFKNTYRTNGWTGIQVIHHLADSHMNAYCRFKLALTEDNPTIKPYFENRWAETPDNTCDISVSLQIVEGVHARWTQLMELSSEADFDRTFFHPESNRKIKMSEIAAMYAWHSDHHFHHLQIIANL